MSIKHFFSYQNMFQINYATISPQEKLFLFAGVIAVLVSVVFKISQVLSKNPSEKVFRGKLFSVFLFFGLGEVVWYFFRYQNIMFFGTLFIALLIALVSIAWLIWVVVKYFKNHKQDNEFWEKEQTRLKYLPK